jgi:hypothetical protein
MAEQTKAAAAEWEDTFIKNRMPYTETPFESVQAIIREHFTGEKLNPWLLM